MDTPAPLPEAASGWIVDDFERTVGGLVVDREVHVSPVDDVMPHICPADECWCGPRVELADGATVVVHASADGRELVEG